MGFNPDEKRRAGKIISRKNTLSQEVKKSIFMLVFTLLGLIVILSIVFLLNTSQSSQKGYILNQEQLKKEQLNLQNRDLVNKIIQAMTYNRIDASPIRQSMQQPETIQYVDKEKNNP
jgi:hypothetical protein